MNSELLFTLFTLYCITVFFLIDFTGNTYKSILFPVVILKYILFKVIPDFFKEFINIIKNN